MIHPDVKHSLASALSKFSAGDTDKLRATCNYAIALHVNQLPRPSGESYDNHIIRVAARLVNDFGIVDKDLFIAALLHDSVEDQLDKLVGHDGSSRSEAYQILSQTYSPRVSHIIQGLSNSEEYNATDDRDKRNELYIQHVIDECEKSDDCAIVKLSDFFDNAMQLQQNTTAEARLKGAAKYLPLFDYFINLIATNERLPFSIDVKQSLTNRIQEQKKYVIELI